MCSFVANDVTIVGSSLGGGLIHFLSHVKMDAIYQLFCVIHTYHPIALLILHEEKTGLTHFFLFCFAQSTLSVLSTLQIGCF